MTAHQQLFQLPDGSRAILEAAALLEQPFSVSLLIDLGFSADALDPLFDNGIFREPFPNRAEFTNSELRNELVGKLSWSKKRRFCEQVGELLSDRRDTLDEAADYFCRAHRYRDARVCRVQAAEEACHSGQYTKAFSLPPGLVRIRHYGILGNNRRKHDIEAARAIFISRGHAVEPQPRSVANNPMCCPSCGKAGIRLVAFTDAAAVLHMIRVGPIPCDSS